jgi:hypothetical protein
MAISLAFLIALLAALVAMNWRVLAAAFGGHPSACQWSRIHARDREGLRAWFCPSCGREEFVDGGSQPPDCGARLDGHRQREG